MQIPKNHGGKINYTVGQKVRRINLDGTVTSTEFQILSAHSNRHGLVDMMDTVTNEVVQVHNSRIMPTDYKDEALVVAVADKYFVICTNCGDSVLYVGEIGSHSCQKCTKTSELKWLCPKPIGVIPKPKVKRVKKTSLKMDVQKLLSLEHCELWWRTMVFDHPEVDAKTYMLIYSHDSVVRKLCFNTYNGMLGKKAKELPIEGFLAGTGTGWYLTTAEKVQKELENGKYIRIVK
jgi:hypothetical protein